METENTNQCIQPIDLMGSMASLFFLLKQKELKRTELMIAVCTREPDDKIWVKILRLLSVRYLYDYD